MHLKLSIYNNLKIYCFQTFVFKSLDVFSESGIRPLSAVIRNPLCTLLNPNNLFTFNNSYFYCWLSVLLLA